MTHRRHLPDDPGALLRYRCPADLGDDPGRHLAFDLRLPVLMQALRKLPTRCTCGGELVHWMADRPPYPARADG